MSDVTTTLNRPIHTTDGGYLESKYKGRFYKIHQQDDNNIWKMVRLALRKYNVD